MGCTSKRSVLHCGAGHRGISITTWPRWPPRAPPINCGSAAPCGPADWMSSTSTTDSGFWRGCGWNRWGSGVGVKEVRSWRTAAASRWAVSYRSTPRGTALGRTSARIWPRSRSGPPAARAGRRPPGGRGRSRIGFQRRRPDRGCDDPDPDETVTSTNWIGSMPRGHAQFPARSRHRDLPGTDLRGCEEISDFLRRHGTEHAGAGVDFGAVGGRAVIVGASSAAFEAARLLLGDADVLASSAVNGARRLVRRSAIRAVVVLSPSDASHGEYTLGDRAAL